MIPILEVIRLSTDYLLSKDILSAKRDVEDLLANMLSIKRIDLYLQYERPLDKAELQVFREMLKRRANKEPVLHILGKCIFYDTEILVSPDVLIPRPETELLVEKVVKTLEQEDLKGRVLWDLCTGSGCIAIALKKRFPELEVVAADVCVKALEIAKKNSQKNGVQLTFLQGDFFAPFSGKTCHYLVSNPPYIAAEEFHELDFQVRNFEPKKALFGGVKGLRGYAHIANVLKKYLNVGGKAWFEMGAKQSADVCKIFNQAGFKNCLISQDYAGHNRFFFLERDSFDRVS